MKLRFAWGLSIYLSSAIVMLVASLYLVYLKFTAQRTLEKP